MHPVCKRTFLCFTYKHTHGYDYTVREDAEDRFVFSVTLKTLLCTAEPESIVDLTTKKLLIVSLEVVWY